MPFTVAYSNHHSELTPADANQHDKLIVNKHIKDTAETGCVDGSPFKVVLISEADRLSREAQAGLRRTMEEYVSKCRLILICDNLSRVIEPLRSRCLLLRVEGPDPPTMKRELAQVCTRENVPYLEATLEKVVESAGCNMRWALIQLQLEKNRGRLTEPREIKVPWKEELEKIAVDLMGGQNVQKMIPTRTKLYEFLQQCIPGELVLTTLADLLMRGLSHRGQVQLATVAADCERMMQMGSKAIVHLEAFCAQAMLLLKEMPK